MKTEAEASTDLMRHTPLLSKTLLDAANGRLKEGDFPYLEKPAKGKAATRRLIVFFVGGRGTGVPLTILLGSPTD